MPTTMSMRRAFAGPVILSGGFRPFFLSAGLWAMLAMALWIAALTGLAQVPGPFAPLDWHVHEFLFGYLAAAVAGFLLTAIPNWTGRLPVIGAPLLALWLLWLAGRLAVLGVLGLPPLGVAVVDVAFALVLTAVAGREIVAGRVWRNLPVVGLAALMAVANALFHAEAAGGMAAGGAGARLGIAAVIGLILLIGGRITPSFTRNWLAQRRSARLPAPADRLDTRALAVAGVALAAWVLNPGSGLTGLLCLLAGAANAWRLSRWAGWHTRAEPLLAVLHVAYAFAPLGFLLTGAAVLWPDAVPRVAALHAWMAGAAGLMTLAVMMRASLGHSGRALAASRAMTALMALLVLGALARVAAGFLPGSMTLLHLSALAWIAAFGGFVLLFWPILTRPKG
jgi:uncharacterized protein involved in response to NO